MNQLNFHLMVKPGVFRRKKLYPFLILTCAIFLKSIIEAAQFVTIIAMTGPRPGNDEKTSCLKPESIPQRT